MSARARVSENTLIVFTTFKCCFDFLFPLGLLLSVTIIPPAWKERTAVISIIRAQYPEINISALGRQSTLLRRPREKLTVSDHIKLDENMDKKCYHCSSPTDQLFARCSSSTDQLFALCSSSTDQLFGRCSFTTDQLFAQSIWWQIKYAIFIDIVFNSCHP